MKKLAIGMALTLLSCVSQATIISSQSDFSDITDWTINGDAQVNANDRLALTQTTSQSGSAFLTNSVSLLNDSSFSSFFEFEISNPSGSTDSADGQQGADGLTFVVQTNTANVGTFGGGIGYQNIANSVGIEFDTWENVGDLGNGNHVGINTGGNIVSIAQANEASLFNTGGIWSVWVDYDGLNDLLEVRWSDNGVRSTAAGLAATVDLASELGTNDAFFGFTSGTGSAGGLHEILSYEFTNDFNPTTEVSAPTTLGIFTLALAGLFVRRKSIR